MVTIGVPEVPVRSFWGGRGGTRCDRWILVLRRPFEDPKIGVVVITNSDIDSISIDLIRVSLSASDGRLDRIDELCTGRFTP